MTTEAVAAAGDGAVGAAAESRGGIVATALKVRYPGRATPALTGVDLVAEPGERIGIAGRTGAGKSTLALAVAGFLPRVVRATVGEGSLRVDGLDPVKAPPSDLLGRVGIVFATPANQLSASKLSVREELAFGLENLGVARAEMDQRIDDVMGRLGIAHLADREPFALSGGERQRVAIASIVAMGSRVLALDEPTAQLDPAGTDAVASLLAELARAGTTILVAEHDPAVLGDTNRIVVLEGGTVAASDVPGRALGNAALAPLGLEPPTLVALAEAAGLDPDDAFNEVRIGEALAVGPTRWADRPPADNHGARVWSLSPTGRRWLPRSTASSIATRAASKPSGACRSGSSRVRRSRSSARTGPARPRSSSISMGSSGRTPVVSSSAAATSPINRSTSWRLRSASYSRVPTTSCSSGASSKREVSFGPRTLGIESGLARRLIDGAIAAAGLDDARTTNPYDLDLSRRKLVALASVLAIDPAVLVLDEPTTGQDGPGVRRVGEIVDAIAAAGRSVVAITHDMEFAARHFGRIVVMRQGEVALDGPPEAVFAAAHAGLLASTGLAPPPAARIAARLGLGDVPADAATLLGLLGDRSRDARKGSS